MAMRRVRSRGMNLGRHGEIGYAELDNRINENFDEGNRLHELAIKFSSDKIKLEDEIDKVRSSKISEKDKKRIIETLITAIEELQQQYEDDVAAEEIKVQKEIMDDFETIDEAVEELDQQVDSLGNITMDASATDAKAAANEAENKKQEFIRMKNKNTEKLKLQMEQAETMKRQIMARHLSGK